jgi:hypothetical protein
MRKKFIWHKNRPFMLVEPRPWMLRSSLITDALKSGGHLAVEMNEGYLTVVRNFENVEETKTLTFSDLFSVHPLPEDLEVAAIKIKDYLLIREKLDGPRLENSRIQVRKNGEIVDERSVSLEEYERIGFKGVQRILERFIS